MRKEEIEELIRLVEQSDISELEIADGRKKIRISKGIARWKTDFDPPTAPYNDLGSPIADAGPDQVVFDEAILDGSGSSDPDNLIVSYDWELLHREDSIHDITTSGINPTIPGLAPGLYDVTLTVTDEDDLTDTDTMLLAAAGSCEPAPDPVVIESAV